MLAEALKFLTEISRKSAEPNQLKIGGRKRVIFAEDFVERFEEDRPARVDKVTNVDSLKAWVEAHAGTQIEVFVGDNSVLAVLDRESAVADQVTMALEPSAASKGLTALMAGPLQQKQVIRLLRGPLANAVSDSVVACFRQVTFRSSSVASKENASFGKVVEKAAQGSAGDLPETIVVELPMTDLDNAPSFPVVLSVEVDFETERFEFVERGDGLSQARRKSLMWLRAYLSSMLPESSVITS